jgi:hypothetical protein
MAVVVRMVDLTVEARMALAGTVPVRMAPVGMALVREGTAPARMVAQPM